MIEPRDFGKLTLKDFLEKRIGSEKADRVLKGVNEAYQNGTRGDDLMKYFQDSLTQEGHPPAPEESGIVFGFAFIS